MSTEFEAWPKIPRHGKGKVIVTEKLDGTNAQIFIVPWFKLLDTNEKVIHKFANEEGDLFCVFAGSRNRYITPEQDNYGFARWVAENIEDLQQLDVGRHFGEWYGAGIQRRYDLDHKRFALFNVQRWGEHNPSTPDCCEAVPILYQDVGEPDTLDKCMSCLKETGSVASKGFMNPEGVIMYNTATKQLLKSTFESPNGKWEEK